MAEYPFRLSPTAIEARREAERRAGAPEKLYDPDRMCRVANAMMDYRAQHINEPLARLWHRLAKVALETE